MSALYEGVVRAGDELPSELFEMARTAARGSLPMASVSGSRNNRLAVLRYAVDEGAGVQDPLTHCRSRIPRHATRRVVDMKAFMLFHVLLEFALAVIGVIEIWLHFVK